VRRGARGKRTIGYIDEQAAACLKRASSFEAASFEAGKCVAEPITKVAYRIL
jgi:hypothetical protein